MSLSMADCVLEGQALASPRKRSTSHRSITNAYSAKRRRISLASVDLTREMQCKPGATSELGPETVADRFVPSRPKQSLPLNITPRTNRIARLFELTDDRILNFADTSAPSTPPLQMFSLLRRSVSELFQPPQSTRPTSVTANLALRKQFILALDGPGIPEDTFAYPISWSLKNYIAVACGSDVHYQNLNTKTVSHLCRVEKDIHGRLQVIEWAGKERQDTLALGTTTGTVQLWDAGVEQNDKGRELRSWQDPGVGVGAMSWHENVLAVGKSDGTFSMFDWRVKDEAKRVVGHKGKVLGVKWSVDGKYMASGDDLGAVYIWDCRACKSLSGGGTRGAKMRHQGPVKALAWCPWKPDLLATGSTYPEGKIRIWSSSSLSSPPSPLSTIPLNTSVMSLHWSPHCRELLSTHGSSFAPPPLPSRSFFDDAGPSANAISRARRHGFKALPSPLTHSLVVHAYPSCKRLLTISAAHIAAVGHSCLSPDGTKVFTVCPREEAMKMWKVWETREEVERRDSVFDKCAIR